MISAERTMEVYWSLIIDHFSFIPVAGAPRKAAYRSKRCERFRKWQMDNGKWPM